MLLQAQNFLKGTRRKSIWWCLPLKRSFPGGSEVKNLPAVQKMQVWSLGIDVIPMQLFPWVGKLPWRRKWQPTPVFLPEKIPWTEQPGKAAVCGVAKSRTRLSDWAYYTSEEGDGWIQDGRETFSGKIYRSIWWLFLCVYVHAFLFQLNMTEFRYYTLNKGNALCLQLFTTCMAGFWSIKKKKRL